MTQELWKISNKQNQILAIANLNINENSALSGLQLIDAPNVDGIAGREASVIVLGMTQDAADKKAKLIITQLNTAPVWQDVALLQKDIKVILGCKADDGKETFKVGIFKNEFSEYFIDEAGNLIEGRVLCWMPLTTIPPMIDFNQPAVEEDEYSSWNF